MDICPPFGLRSSAMMTVRTTKAIVHIHETLGYTSLAYIDNLGGGGGGGGGHCQIRTSPLQPWTHYKPYSECLEWRKLSTKPGWVSKLTLSPWPWPCPSPPPPTKITEIRTLLDAWECKKRASNERSRAFLAFYSMWPRWRPLPGHSLTASLRLSMSLTRGNPLHCPWVFARTYSFFSGTSCPVSQLLRSWTSRIYQPSTS